jgi:O-antigen/teichoic acid export membrane protein
MRWLAVTPLLFAIGFVGMYAMVARGGQWVVVTVTAVALAVNVSGNLVLIPRLAGTAAAIDTVVSYAVLAAPHATSASPRPRHQAWSPACSGCRPGTN